MTLAPQVMFYKREGPLPSGLSLTVWSFLTECCPSVFSLGSIPVVPACAGRCSKTSPTLGPLWASIWLSLVSEQRLQWTPSSVAAALDWMNVGRCMGVRVPTLSTPKVWRMKQFLLVLWKVLEVQVAPRKAQCSHQFLHSSSCVWHLFPESEEGGAHVSHWTMHTHLLSAYLSCGLCLGRTLRSLAVSKVAAS